MACPSPINRRVRIQEPHGKKGKEDNAIIEEMVNRSNKQTNKKNRKQNKKKKQKNKELSNPSSRSCGRTKLVEDRFIRKLVPIRCIPGKR